MSTFDVWQARQGTNHLTPQWIPGDSLRLLDQMSRHYGVLPSELLASSATEQDRIDVDLAVMLFGMEEDA